MLFLSLRKRGLAPSLRGACPKKGTGSESSRCLSEKGDWLRVFEVPVPLFRRANDAPFGHAFCSEEGGESLRAQETSITHARRKHDNREGSDKTGSDCRSALHKSIAG